VLSLALDKHMYVTVSPRFEPSTRVAYTRTEIVDHVKDLRHELVREALKMTGLGRHLEITTVGDVPAGAGLGSSSSLTVGVLLALYAYKGQIVSAKNVAEQACRIEIDVLGKPIGKQDQYAASFGGMNYMRFNPDGSVDVEPVPTTPETMQELSKRILLLYTEQQRDADGILKLQSAGTKDRMPVLRAMRDLAQEMRLALGGGAGLDEFARLLHEGWKLKRSLGFGIALAAADAWYEQARKLGAQGGKLLGAGGGGFLLLFAPPERHNMIRDALGHPRELTFGIDRRGGRIIFISDHQRLLHNQ
jgi:D-glycero-alpha-D-manno-heptose-7-phosphate kinase